MSVLRHLPTKRVLAAATRLAAVYAIGVAALIVGTSLAFGSPGRIFTDLAFLSIPAAICFAAAFLLLGVARRAGFTALWLLILGLWALETFALRIERIGWPQEMFVTWTILAVPLYAMVAVGFPSAKSATPRRHRLVAWSIGVAWAALAAMALLDLRSDFDPGLGLAFSSRPWWTLLELLWLGLPPTLTLRAILRVYTRVPPEASLA